MTEEPSAKRPRGETSDKNSEVDDVQVPGKKLDYTRTKGLRPLVMEDKLYTFVGFSIEGDKQKPQEFGLEINPDNYIDIQHKWRVPCMIGKRLHSFADIARSVIHPFYKNMKKKINREEDP
ncbi:hypothetical protein D1007_29118 [Hordeum vulgare]|nr:hypothetical protein D1007_29118 [Hordeum vulgare]